jgi:superfamily II DNA or RNA helicase
MPRIFDNIESQFLPSLEEILSTATSADFCVGYFNLRGWNRLGRVTDDHFTGKDNSRVRLLVGMQSLPDDEVRTAYSIIKQDGIDAAAAIKFKRRMAEHFRDQLTIGAPTDSDEINLRRLAQQLRNGKLVVRLFLKNNLHAKLYLVHRDVPGSQVVGFVGSSNLTFAGLVRQYELNVDVVDSDASQKLAKWFNDRWSDQWCIDITKDLADIIEQSWARPTLIPPYHIYLKMAYHLAQEARMGLSEFRIPKDFGNQLFEYQVAAVKIAAHHLNDERRRGVILGDVVGLGKTLMATTLARIFEDDLGLETLILCPKNLTDMWEDYAHKYRLRAKVLSVSLATTELPTMRRYRLVIIDESHNLRNREGSRYRAIKEYITQNECRCILLSATPYNKSYLDLAAQLRLFVSDSQNVGIRPEKYIREVGDIQFQAKHQCPQRSLAAFEMSPYADDWRELMRLYMVRRTRGFIKENYANVDPITGRRFLLLADGTSTFFPERKPKTVKFEIDESDNNDPYARLFNQSIVNQINTLSLPRYGLGNYVSDDIELSPSDSETKVLQDLGRAGKRLMGFCRTNLFKRLESSGMAFIQSIERHVLRNYIYLHAIENNLPLPVGTTDPSMLDAQSFDADADDARVAGSVFEEETIDGNDLTFAHTPMSSPEGFRQRAEQIYNSYSSRYVKRFRWLRPNLFDRQLHIDLQSDCDSLCRVLSEHGTWYPDADKKLRKLFELINVTHASDKVLVFTQFADTVKYLTDELRRRGVQNLAGVTGLSDNPTHLAHRFSPISNGKRELVSSDEELRVLIATDVLSEGQNLQDAWVVVNFDLPWAIIRLIQRAGRVDRIGQQHSEIVCYSFYPMDGVDRIISLRGRVRQRLTENAEVVGADEQFFEDLQVDERYRDLYNEQSGILDGDEDSEVDLSSLALQIWKKATDADPSLKTTIESMPDVVYSTKEFDPKPNRPPGALIYMRDIDGADSLSWIDEFGSQVTESPLAVLRAAECEPGTLPVARLTKHHEIVKKGVERLVKSDTSIGGQLGKPSGARFRTYQRLKDYATSVGGTLLDTVHLTRVIEDIYRFPLRQSAIDTLNRQLKSGIADENLAELCISMRNEERLCMVSDDIESRDAKIICTLGLVGK